MEYSAKQACILHLILLGIPSSLEMFIKNKGVRGGGLLNRQNVLSVWQKLFANSPSSSLAII